MPKRAPEKTSNPRCDMQIERRSVSNAALYNRLKCNPACDRDASALWALATMELFASIHCWRRRAQERDARVWPVCKGSFKYRSAGPEIPVWRFWWRFWSAGRLRRSEESCAASLSMRRATNAAKRPRLMTTANAVRKYTADDLAPLLPTDTTASLSPRRFRRLRSYEPISRPWRRRFRLHLPGARAESDQSDRPRPGLGGRRHSQFHQ